MALQFPFKDTEWSCIIFPHKKQLRRKELASELFEVENLKQPLSGNRSSNIGDRMLRWLQTQTHYEYWVVFIFFSLGQRSQINIRHPKTHTHT